MTYCEIAVHIANVRYGVPGKILFDYRGNTIAIREPADVLLVGYDEPAKHWLARNFGFLLSAI